MSIDYYIFNFDGPLPPDEIMSAEGYKSQPLGSVEAVQKMISRYVPEAEWRWEVGCHSIDRLAGHVTDKGYLIELSISADEDGLVYCIGVHPYGIAEAEPVMRRFCLPHGWYVWNPQSGEWVEPSKLAESLVVEN